MSRAGIRLSTIVDALLDATMAGRAAWKPTDMPGSYVLVRPSGSIAIQHLSSSALRVGPHYEISVRDRQGVETDHVAVGPFAGTAIQGTIPLPDDEEITVEERIEIRGKLIELFRIIALQREMIDDRADQVARDLLDEL